MKKNILSICLFSLVLIIAFSSMSVAKDKNTFIYAAGTEPLTLDTHTAPDNNTGDMVLQIHEGLVERGEDGSFVPCLALKWSVSDDGRSWNFKLREGVKFHDRTPFNAQAVKYNFERMLDPKTGSRARSAFIAIEKVTVINNYEVVITTKDPFGPMLDLLTTYNATMMSPTAVKKYGKEYSFHPAGTGPLELDEWIKGVKFILKRFDGYWGKRVSYEKLEYKTVPEEATRIMLLQAGEVDIVKGISPIQVDRLKQDKNVNLILKPGPRTIFLGMNLAFKPFDDQRVRQAIQYAINRESIIMHILKGYAMPVVGIPSPVITHAAKYLLPEYRYDPEKAKKLLAEAGYPNGFKTTLMTPEGRYPMDRTVAEVIQGQLKEVGINAELKVMEWGAYVAAFIAKKETRLFLLGKGNPPLDIDFTLSKIFLTGMKANYSQYSNPEVDRLMELQRKTVDFKKRGQILYVIQTKLQEDSPWACLYYQNQIIGVRSDIKGMRVNPNEQLYFKGLYRK